MLVFGLLAAVIIWTLWAEGNPESERELRVSVRENLHEWFPEQMALPEDMIGFVSDPDPVGACTGPDVVLLHGLDEPGGIWDATLEALEDAGLAGWEFRYPNDQALDHSADLLARYWGGLDPDRPVVLVGHSMGGLVIRDFVSRWLYPGGMQGPLGGPPVAGVIQVGTPNQGSEWARFRVWLEIREMLADIPEGRFSLFAGLRDGTGAAKIDLRPGSAYLEALDSRIWPGEVPLRIIGGVLAEPTEAMAESIQSLPGELGSEEHAAQIQQWWAEAAEGLGDGVVPVESLGLSWAPPPLILEASHRGLLVQGPLEDVAAPPAVGPIVELLESWIPTSRPCGAGS